MADEGLQVVNTYSRAEGEKGEVMGLVGRQFLIPLTGLLMSAGLAVISTFTSFAPPVVRFSVAALPLVVTVTWVLLFVIGKPPHYARDTFQQLLDGPHIGTKPFWKSSAEAPIISARRKTIKV